MEARPAMSSVLATSLAPRILTPEGIAPPEKHADRIIAEMLRHIAREHAGTFERVLAAIKPDYCGNPKAQRRTCKRIIRNAGETLINVMLEPGKRGKFTIALFDWCAWDDGRGKEIEAGDSLPQKPWLCCCFTTITGLGGGKREVESRHALFVTHHALSRLAQRCGVRTIDDMIVAVAALWRAYFHYRTREECLEKTPDGTRLAVKLPNGKTAFAVLRRHDEQGLIVVTAIGASESREAASANVSATDLDQRELELERGAHAEP
jgi:hypothetical protein